MTAIAQATSQAVAEWSKIFPRQVTENLTSSVTFMKQLTVVAVSTLSYFKGVFSDDNYVFESFGGLRVMALKNKCKDELAQFLSTALTQAFEAFDKKYLHQLALCFYDGDITLDNLIEYHIFEYSYKEGGVSMRISSKSREMKSAVTSTLDGVRAQTMHLIRACVVMTQTCRQRLPETCDVSLRLYYNDDAPEGYQAPGFLAPANSEDPLGYTYESALKLGCVETPYHKLTLRTYVKDSTEDSHEAIPSQNPPKMTQAVEDYSSAMNSSRNSDSEAGGPALRCACNNFECDDAPAALLTCQYCNTQQHATCYGLPARVAARSTRHCCAPCALRDPRREPTDRLLAEVAPGKRESIAILRRALELCSHTGAVAARDFCERIGLSHVSASKLMKLLHREGIIRQEPDSDISTPAQIIPDKLKLVKSRYFQSLEEDIVDRLVAETFASQGSQPDPVGDILSPIEKVSLQNASQMGRVIHPEVNNNVEDSTIKQYREAFIMVEKMDDNLPLSGDPVKDMEKMEKKSAKRRIGNDEKVVTGVKTKRAKIRRNM